MGPIFAFCSLSKIAPAQNDVNLYSGQIQDQLSGPTLSQKMGTDGAPRRAVQIFTAQNPSIQQDSKNFLAKYLLSIGCMENIHSQGVARK